MRLAFAGTPDFAARVLQSLLDADHVPVAVYTQPDRPTGRGRRLHPSPVKQLAIAHQLPVRQPASLRPTEEVEALRSLDLDVMVVAAYGLLLPESVLAVPRRGCLNVHASLLPRWRGAAPVERAIMAGDRETGACIMQMDKGLDTGPVYICRRCPIEPDVDGTALERRLAELGGEALLEVLPQLDALTPSPQPDQGVTYAHKLTAADSVVNWTQSAEVIARQVRALSGRAPAWGLVDGVRLRLLAANAAPDVPATATPGSIVAADRRGIRIACGEGQLCVTRLSLSVGKGRPLTAADALNGYGTLLAPGRMLHSGDEAP